METPAEVLIHNEILGIKGGKGTLLQISADGYYEVNCQFGERFHRTLFPVETTVIIQREPEPLATSQDLEIER
jgi:hypothetical protein